ncbi:MAG: Crp/Fnr family transcriptional regulator [Comamonadaceae bacterium]|nr:Crp/Fnr family transcriptional regulator [Comamonadaceae bacterium]
MHPHPVEFVRSASGADAAPPPGYTARRLARGQRLRWPGDASNRVFVVASGRLRVHLAGTSRELTLAFLEPGDIYSTHSPAWVTAAVASTVWTVETRAFAQRMSADPALLPPVMAVLGRLARRRHRPRRDLAFREVPARLARFVLGLAERRGEPEGEGWLLPLDLGVEDIASLLGSTRQTVSALISRWQRDGLLLRRGRRRLPIPSADARQRLERPAAGDANVGWTTDSRRHPASSIGVRVAPFPDVMEL